MSADACPVCGSPQDPKGWDLYRSWKCGRVVSLRNQLCGQAESLAISRSAEIERLKAALETALRHLPSDSQAALNVAQAIAKSGDEISAKWTDRRTEELESLNALLFACMDIDRANNTLARLAKIIQLSEQLSTHSVQEPRPSFLEFLNQLCRDDRRNQRNQETK